MITIDNFYENSNSIDSDFLSDNDILSFNSFLGSSIKRDSSKSLDNALAGKKMLTDSSRENTLERVINKKNELMINSKASAAKKAAELAKEISF